MDTQTNITEQYKKYRNEILDAFRKAQPVLNQAKAKLVKGDSELPTEKLENEKFTLTLVGGFQSGKSTLFSYLCGGWELSKVGAGLRTTGCCVTATALQEGEPNYAEITWFSEDEIKEAISDYIGKDVKEIHLNNPTWCRKFEEELLKQSRIQERPATGGNTSEKELNETPLALLMLHFFNKYKAKCEKGDKIRFDDVEKALPYSCYPNKWEQTWSEIKSVPDIDRAFQPDDAGFVFCKQIDYYIDSPYLRALGCTIQDCPGMFASKRDSDLACKIIRKSDAILCTLQGDKGLSAEERKCIEECKAIGVTDKIFFGVNLHKSLHAWEQTIKPEVQAMLKNMGIKKEITHYHAPLALCCSELLQLQYDELHQVSKNAIQHCIEASKCKSDTPENYLQKRINFWIWQLDGGEGDCFDNYRNGGNIQWAKLEDLHQVSTLIVKLKNTLLPDKMKSLLLDGGLSAACGVVDRLVKRLKDMIDKLSSEKQRTDDEIREKEEKIKEFEEERRNCEKRYEDIFGSAITERLDPKGNPKFDALIQDGINKYQSQVIADIEEKYMYGSSDFWEKEERRKAFALYMQDMVRNILVEIRERSLSEMLPEEIKYVQMILRRYTEEIRMMVAKTLEGAELQPPRMKEYGQEYIEQIPVLPYKEVEEIFAEHEKSTLRQMLDYVTLGLTSDMGEEERARIIWENFRPKIFPLIKESLRNMLLYAKDSPLEDLRVYIASIKSKCDTLCAEYREDLKTEQAALQKSASERGKEKEEYDALKSQLENVRNDFDEIAGKVRKDF